MTLILTATFLIVILLNKISSECCFSFSDHYGESLLLPRRNNYLRIKKRQKNHFKFKEIDNYFSTCISIIDTAENISYKYRYVTRK